MDRSFYQYLQERPQIVAAFIAAITVMVLVLNGYGLSQGITNVLPHLFYIPIILTAYYFPRRAILFTVVVSAIYCAMTFYFNPVVSDVLLSAGGRVIMFILIAAVVSVLTIRMRESEIRFRGVAERSSDVILLIGMEGRAMYASPSVKRILGYDPSEITGKPPAEFIHPGDLESSQEEFIKAQKGAPVEVITTRFRKKDGDYVFLEFFGTPIITEGTVSGIQVIGRDVTERKRVEEASRETRRRLAEIIEFLPDPTMVIDKEGVVVAWNHAMEVMSGVPASSILRKGKYLYREWISGSTGPIIIDYVLQQDFEGIKSAYPNAHVEGDIVRTEKDITRADGTRFSLWISSTPLIDQKGAVTGAIESLRDVTDLKRVQRALRESNAYLDALIDTLADPLFIKDRNHRFVKLNNSFCQFSGHKREELLGKTDYDFFRKEEADIFQEKDEEVFLTGHENENEEDITDSKGTTHIISTKKTLYTNAAGEKFIVGIIRDITERKKTELALQQALKKLNMLSSITRHDILNQLTGLLGFLELTLEREKDPGLLSFLKKGEESARAIQRQIEFTRYYENLGVQTPEWQDVEELFRSAISYLQIGEISANVQISGLSVYADPLIGKVFYNLIENSLRHGKQVTALVLSAHGIPDGLVITYQDNGVGIASEDKGKLFRRGFGKHTGLGLFLSQEILSITGITITENGEPGKGVRFEITVPNGMYRIKEQ